MAVIDGRMLRTVGNKRLNPFIRRDPAHQFITAVQQRHQHKVFIDKLNRHRKRHDTNDQITVQLCQSQRQRSAGRKTDHHHFFTVVTYNRQAVLHRTVPRLPLQITQCIGRCTMAFQTNPDNRITLFEQMFAITSHFNRRSQQAMHQQHRDTIRPLRVKNKRRWITFCAFVLIDILKTWLEVVLLFPLQYQQRIIELPLSQSMPGTIVGMIQRLNQNLTNLPDWCDLIIVDRNQILQPNGIKITLIKQFC